MARHLAGERGRHRVEDACGELSVSGLPGLQHWCEPTIGVGAATSRIVPVKVRLPAGAAQPGSHPIEFRLRALGVERIEVRERSVFIVR